jgi:hypothetical protein
MNAQLQNLRRAGAQSSAAGPAPFGPAGHEPSAQSLLADVKSRLDLLALRMSQQRR